MPRSNPRYYLAPTAVSITPNANNSANDLAVYIAKGTKIKVCEPHIPDLRTIDASFQEWALAGRNRRLADSTKPYTIYARLRKTEHTDDGDITHYDDAYLVFAEQRNDGTLAEPDWKDPYVLSPNTSKTDTMMTTDLNGEERTWAPIPTKQVEGMANTGNRPRSDYWWLKLGTVSATDANNKRTVDFDPGILDTDQYNADWELEPDALPLRVDLDCTVNGREAGAVPCVYWGTTLRINAHLIEGWEKDRCDEVALWTIRRDTGNAEADEAWNDHNDKKGRTMNVTDGEGGGYYEMAHLIDNDAFDGVPSTQFVITAWGQEQTIEPTGSAEAIVANIADFDGVANGYVLVEGSADIYFYNDDEGTLDVDHQASEGDIYYVNDDDHYYRFDGTTWEDLGTSAETGQPIKLASTALTVQAEVKGSYEVDLSGYIDVVTVDDAGNLIGGLYTTTQGGNAYRTYRIHSAITVRKEGDPLLFEETQLDEDENPLPASKGHYTISGQKHNCDFLIEDSTIYITKIDNIKDGEAGTDDDNWTSAQYEAMRQMESCSVDLTIDCEGVVTVIKNFPVTIKHDSQPYIGAVLTNMSSGISWNSKEQHYIGLPVTTDVEMWRNDEYLTVTECSLSVPPNSGVELQQIESEDSADPTSQKLQYMVKKIEQTRNGKTYYIACITIVAAPQDLPTVVPINITAETTYAGVDYERQLTHTLNKYTDTNIYQVKPSAKNIHVSYNAEGIRTADVGSVTCRITCDSTDDKHYDITLEDGVNKQHRILATSRIDTINTEDGEHKGETVIGVEKVYDERNAIDVNVNTMRNIRFAAYTVNDAAYLNMTRSQLDELLRRKDTTFLNSLHEEDSQDVPLISDGIEGSDGIVADLRNEHVTIVWSTKLNGWRNLNAAQTTATVWRANDALEITGAELYVNGDTNAHKANNDYDAAENTHTFTWTSGGNSITVTFNRETRLLKVTALTVASMPMTIVLTLELKATHDGTTYTRKLNFIIDVQRDGYSFELVPIVGGGGWNAEAVSEVHGVYGTSGYTYTPAVVSCAIEASDDNGPQRMDPWSDDIQEAGVKVRIGYRVNGRNGSTISFNAPDSDDERYDLGITINDNVESITYILYKKNATSGLYEATNETETVPVVRDGVKGPSGDTPVSCFRWYKDEVIGNGRPIKPESTVAHTFPPAAKDHIGNNNEARPEYTWSQNADNRPASGWSLWMSQSTRHISSNGATSYDTWSPPVRISGTDGTPGEDGKEREWIYQLGQTSALPQVPSSRYSVPLLMTVYAIVDSVISTPITDNGDAVLIRDSATIYEWDADEGELIATSTVANIGAVCQMGDDDYYLWDGKTWRNIGDQYSGGKAPGNYIDDFVPAGWYDNALVINETDKFLFGCWRDYDHGDKIWGDFQGPVILSSWGHNGIDGDGVEYVYIRTKVEVAPAVYYADEDPIGGTDSQNRTPSDDEYLPAVYISSLLAESGDIEPNDVLDRDSGSWLNGEDFFGECTDDPKGPTELWPYEWVLKRRKYLANDGHTRYWKDYLEDRYDDNAMSLWAKWSEDGISPTFTYTEEAWSPDAEIPANCNHPKTEHYDADVDIPNNNYQDWSVSTPAKPNNPAYIYLWRRSRLKVFNASTRVYDWGENSWHYIRLNGTNGTSIDIQGSVIAIIAPNDTEPTGKENDLYIKQGQARLFKHSGASTNPWSQTGPTASDGDAYVITAACDYDLEENGGEKEDVTGFLFMWSAEVSKWLSLGPFKGEKGDSGYIHIAWTDQVTLADNNNHATTRRLPGQRTTPNAYSVCGQPDTYEGDMTGMHFSISPHEGYDWMGILVDSSETDPQVEDRCLYTWKYTKGEEGASPWVADLDNEMDGIECDADGHPKVLQEVETNVRLWYGSTPKEFYVAVYDGSSLVPTEATTGGIYATYHNKIAVESSAATTDTVKLTFTTSATFNTSGVAKKSYRIVLTAKDDRSVTRELWFKVNGLIGESRYNLRASVDEIYTRRVQGGYDPATASLYCGYVKGNGGSDPVVKDDALSGGNDNGRIDGKYYIYFRRRIRKGATISGTTYQDETWENWIRYTSTNTSYLTNFPLDTYNKVEFILYKCAADHNPTIDGITADNIYDREGVPVVEGGMDGGSVKLDLDNETDIILYDTEGNKATEYVTSQAHLYDKTEEKTGDVSEWSISAYSGVNPIPVPSGDEDEIERNNSNCWIGTGIADAGLLTVNGISQTDSYVIVKAVYNGVPYYAKMSLHKQIGGVKYALRNITPNAISYDPDDASTHRTTVSAYVTRTPATTGIETRATLPSGHYVLFCQPDGNRYKILAVSSGGNPHRYTTDDNSTLSELRIVIVKTDTTPVKDNYVNENTVLDSETLPVARAATGPAGPSVTAYINPNPIVFDAASDGIVDTQDNRQITIGLTVDGNPCDITALNNISCVTSNNNRFVVSIGSGGASVSTVEYDQEHQVNNPTLYVHPHMSSGELDGSISMTVTGTRYNKTYSGVAIATVTTQKQGAPGDAGQDAASVRFEPTEILFDGDSSGNVPNNTTKEFTVHLQLPNGNNCDIGSITGISKPSDLGIQYKYGTGTHSSFAAVPNNGIEIGDNESHPSEISFRLTVNGTNITGNVTMTVTGKKLGKSYTATGSLPVSALKQGTPGTPTTTWRLQAEPSTIHFGVDYANNKSFSPSTFVLKAYKSVGGDTTEYDGSVGGNALPNDVTLVSITSAQGSAESSASLGVHNSTDLLANSSQSSSTVYDYREYRLRQNGVIIASCRVNTEQLYQRMLVPSGTWNATTRYYVTDRTVPLVLCEADGKYYYLDYIRTSTNPVIGTDYAPNIPSTEQFKNPWHEASEYEVVLTKMLIAKYGNIGDAIFYGNYMFSTNGRIGNTPYENSANYPSSNPPAPAYTYFDDRFPDGQGSYTISSEGFSTNSASWVKVAEFFLRKDGVYRLTFSAKSENGTIWYKVVKEDPGFPASSITNTDYETITIDITSDVLTEDGVYCLWAARRSTDTGAVGFFRDIVLVCDGGPLFVPNWYVNLLTGRMSARGNIQARRFDTTGFAGYRINIEGGVFNVYNAVGTIGLSIGWDDSGDPYIMLAKVGADGVVEKDSNNVDKAIRLTYNGVERISADMSADRAVLSPLIPVHSNSPENVHNGNGQTDYYKYHAAKNNYTGVYSMANPSGGSNGETWQTARSNTDGKTFSTNNIYYILYSSSTYIISDGYYLSSNESESNNIYSRTLYQYIGGVGTSVGTVYYKASGTTWSFCTSSGGSVDHPKSLNVNEFINEFER